MLGTIFYRIKNSWIFFYVLFIFFIAVYFNERYTILLFNELGGITVFWATVLLFSINFIIFGFRYRAERNRRKVVLFWCMLFILEMLFVILTVFFIEFISYMFSFSFDVVFDSWILRVTRTYSHDQLLNACYTYGKLYKGHSFNLKQLEMLIRENYNLADVYKTVDVYCGFLSDPTQFYPNYIYRSIDLWLKGFDYDYTWRKYMLETSWFKGAIENNKLKLHNLLYNLEVYEDVMFYFPYTDYEIYRFSNYWYAYNWGIRNIEMMETKLFYDYNKDLEDEINRLTNELNINREAIIAFCDDFFSLSDIVNLRHLSNLMVEEEILVQLIETLKRKQEEHFLRFFWILFEDDANYVDDLEHAFFWYDGLRIGHYNWDDIDLWLIDKSECCYIWGRYIWLLCERDYPGLYSFFLFIYLTFNWCIDRFYALLFWIFGG